VATTYIGFREVKGLPIAFKSGQRALSHRNAVLAFENWAFTLSRLVKFFIEHEEVDLGVVTIWDRSRVLQEIDTFIDQGIAEVKWIDARFTSEHYVFIDDYARRAADLCWRDSKKRKGGLFIPARFSRSPKKNFISLRVPHK
jgi:hypothetical protein